MSEPLRYGKWYQVQNKYVPGGLSAGTYLDVRGNSSCPNNYMDVSGSSTNDRLGQGTGLWRLISATVSPGATPKAADATVNNGETFYLQNCFGAGGYLDVCGACQGCPGNSLDVSASFVRHREGDGSKTSIWQVWRPNSGVNEGLNEGDELLIRSMHNNTYLDVCGAGRSGNILDVSTSFGQDRVVGSGRWSFQAYDDRQYKLIVDQDEDLPPHMLSIESIQCILPSSGVFSALVVGGAASIVAGALAAGGLFAAGAGITAVTAGTAAPAAGVLLFGFGAWVTGASAAFGASVGVLAQKFAASVGQILPDQTYIKVDGNKVWPTNSDSLDMKAGDSAPVAWRAPRSAQSIEIWERDVILSDDLLFQYQLPPKLEFVHYPLVAVNEAAGSSYIIFLTATDERSSRQILIDSHKAALERPLK